MQTQAAAGGGGATREELQEGKTGLSVQALLGMNMDNVEERGQC